MDPTSPAVRVRGHMVVLVCLRTCDVMPEMSDRPRGCPGAAELALDMLGSMPPHAADPNRRLTATVDQCEAADSSPWAAPPP